MVKKRCIYMHVHTQTRAHRLRERSFGFKEKKKAVIRRIVLDPELGWVLGFGGGGGKRETGSPLYGDWRYTMAGVRRAPTRPI